MPAKPGIQVRDFSGFRVALAIASLPGMTDELCSELRGQDMSMFGSNSGHFCFARVCSESFVSLRLAALQLLEEMK